MRRKDITRILAQKYGSAYNKMQAIVNEVLESIMETTLRKGRIELRNFGTFEVRVRRGRPARNPKTGAPVTIETYKTIVFKLGRIPAQRLNMPGTAIGKLPRVPSRSKKEMSPSAPPAAPTTLPPQ
jgi:nucleoid DNA-binding protein